MIIFSLKTVTDDFAFIIDSQRCAIGTLGRRNPSDLIAVLRERCGSKANRAYHSEGFEHEEHSGGFAPQFIGTIRSNRRSVFHRVKQRVAIPRSKEFWPRQSTRRLTPTMTPACAVIQPAHTGQWNQHPLNCGAKLSLTELAPRTFICTSQESKGQRAVPRKRVLPHPSASISLLALR